MKTASSINAPSLGILALALVASALGLCCKSKTESSQSGFKIGIVYFAPDPAGKSCKKGLLDGLAELGFVEGRNLEIRQAHAQGEIANIPSMLQNYDSEDLDLIVTMTTPCLTAACSMVKNKPVVFTYVYDPIAAGVGESRTNHLPNITGVGSFPPIADTIDLIQQLVPGVHSVGTLYNSSEANSRKVVSVARELFRQRNIHLEEVVITNSSEVFQAAQAVVSRSIQALWITGDNTALLGFAGIAKVATDSRIPMIINDQEFLEQGALACAGLGWYESGRAAAKLAARVLLGESPGDIPIEEVAAKGLSLNFEVARRLAITFPPKLIQESNAFVRLRARYGRPARIALVSTQDDDVASQLRAGLVEGLIEAGLISDADFTLEHYSAGGKPERLPDTVSEVQAGQPEIVVVFDEPARIEASKVIQDRPVLAIPEGSEPEAANRAAIRIARALAGVPSRDQL